MAEKKILLLGCGLVVPPLVQYLNGHGFHQTIATRTIARADSIISTLKKPELVEVVKFDIEQKDALTELDTLTKGKDLVISLLPYIFHVKAAEIAIKHKIHYCTASYVSDAMEKLDQRAKDAGVILLNECGVDPGLDHMSAQKIIDEVHAKGGKVVSFTSLCGGLPAPEHNDNPWGYKLSWSPRGVLLASKNSAKYLRDNETVDITGENLFAPENVHLETVEPIGKLEWYHNRDSVSYQSIYSIPESSTVMRGTYRYVGWCRLLKAIADLDLNSMDEIDVTGLTIASAARKILGMDEGSGGDPKAEIAKRLKIGDDDEILSKFEWIGLFSQKILVPDGINTALDVLGYLCGERLVYADKEKDLLLMKHEFQVDYAGNKKETITSTMVDYGQQNLPNGNSSMARTVTLPLAIAVRKILNGDIRLTGIQRPIVPELYNPILEEMAELGVKFVEATL